MLSVAVARSSSDDSGIRYVLPVLWTTSCFYIMGMCHMVSGIGNMDMGKVPQQVVINFRGIRQGALLADVRCPALFDCLAYLA